MYSSSIVSESLTRKTQIQYFDQNYLEVRWWPCTWKGCDDRALPTTIGHMHMHTMPAIIQHMCATRQSLIDSEMKWKGSSRSGKDWHLISTSGVPIAVSGLKVQTQSRNNRDNDKTKVKQFSNKCENNSRIADSLYPSTCGISHVAHVRILSLVSGWCWCLPGMSQNSADGIVVR